MARSVLLKVVLVTALVGLPLIGRDAGAFNKWITPGLVAFGIVNVVFSPRRTSGIRAVAIAGALAALFWPPIQTLVVLLAWLVWPPAVLVAWALGREVDGSPDVEQPERSAAATRARVTIAAIIGAVAIGSLAPAFGSARASLHRGQLRHVSSGAAVVRAERRAPVDDRAGGVPSIGPVDADYVRIA